MGRLTFPVIIALIGVSLIGLWRLNHVPMTPDRQAQPNASSGRPQAHITNQVKKTKLTIAYSGSAPSTDFWEKLSRAIRNEARRQDVVVVDFTADDFSLARQKNNIRQAIESRVDGMILGAVSDGLERAVSELEKYGIPVVSVGVPIANDWITAHVGTSSQEASILAGNYIRDRISVFRNKGCRIVIITGDPDHTQAKIRGEVPAGILRNQGYEVSISFSDDWSGTKALTNALTAFSERPKSICAGFSTFEPGTIAMVEAAESRNIDAVLVGFDWSDAMRQMLINGRMQAAIIQNPERIGRAGLEVMVSLLAGGKTPKIIDVPPVLITGDNVKDY